MPVELMAKFYAFRVTDEDGLWGDMRVKATTEAKARADVREILLANEVEPNGCLLRLFRLTLLPPKLTRQPRRS